MQLIPGCSKRSRCEALIGRDRVRGRDREIHTSTNTLHEHECERGDRAQRSRWAFFNSLLAILYFLGTSSFAASNPFDDAIAAYEGGDYVQAMKVFRQLAEQGHPWAQRRVGSMYAEGKGVPQDYQQAVKWYRLAAAQGNTPAQYSLGLAYEKGQGVRQDFQEALVWYGLAAAQDDEWAQTRLGSIYAEGKGVRQDYQQAVKWYRLAAAQGYAPAEYSLGVAYEKGQGARRMIRKP
jgi:TPR repeat protein